MHIPKNVEDLNSMIYAKVMENIHLDYKSAGALTDPKNHKEISKDVSAFANSDGGVIIYGIAENKHLPERIDPIDNNLMTRERLEQLIRSNISPALSGLYIHQISIDDHSSAYVVAVDRSTRAHQARNQKRYYKRHNFNCEAMEDYEINDIRNRITYTPSLISVHFERDQGHFIELVVENIGTAAALDISFQFSKKMIWHNDNMPVAFENGCSVLAPREKLYFHYATSSEVFSEGSHFEKQFDVAVNYKHEETGKQLEQIFSLDLNKYYGSTIIRSELYHHGRKLENAIKALTNEIKNLDKHTCQLANIAGPTGLSLSYSTMRALGKMLDKEVEFPKLLPEDSTLPALCEILDVDLNTASSIFHHLRYGRPESLEDVENIDSQICEKVRKYFFINDRA